MDAQTLISEGWTLQENTLIDGSFDSNIGSYWTRTVNGSASIGIILEKRHTNGHLGTAHGGLLSTFADIGLGMGVSNIMKELGKYMVTISLSMKFLSIAKIGDFITITPEVTRESKQLVFVRGLIQTNGKTVASTEGIWKLLDSAKTQRK